MCVLCGGKTISYDILQEPRHQALCVFGQRRYYLHGYANGVLSSRVDIVPRRYGALDPAPVAIFRHRVGDVFVLLNDHRECL